MTLTDRDIIKIQFEEIISLEVIEEYLENGLSSVEISDLITIRGIEMVLCAKEQDFDIWNKKFTSSCLNEKEEDK